MPDAECCRMSQTVAKLAGTAATKTREVLQRSKQPPATNFNDLHRRAPDCYVEPRLFSSAGAPGFRAPAGYLSQS
jgi:hypothetical protein